MLCQYCMKNEVNKVFVGHWMGRLVLWHICDECLRQLWQQAEASGHSDTFRAMSGWWPDKEEPRTNGIRPFPLSADTAMLTRRRLNALRFRLGEAENQEDYEKAAQLRDSIAEIQRGEYTHEL